MSWLFLSLATALANALEVTTVKRFFSGLSISRTVAPPMAYSLPLFLLTLPFVEPASIKPGFWTTLAILLPFNILGYFMSLRAVTISPLSLTMPFQALTPMAVLLTGFLILGELPSLPGACGILGIAVGSYVLGIGSGPGKSLLSPIRAVLKERGSVYMILAAILFGLTAVLGKKLLQESSPVTAGLTLLITQNALVVAALLALKKIRPRDLLRQPAASAAAGALLYCHVVFHFSAIALAPAAYMISIKRLSSVFSVIFGGLVFKEEHIAPRLFGAALMTAGAAVIAIWG